MPLVLENKTPFSCAYPPMLARNGANLLRVVVRATYDIGPGGNLVVAAEQAPIRFKDVAWGEDGKSSLRYESDVALERPFADLIINGEACAPKGRPTTSMEVTLMIQNRTVRRLRVCGDRRWFLGAAGWRGSDPKPFVTMPVTYDRAFGGMDDAGSEPRNRCGTGYASRLTNAFTGTLLPNVEDPQEPVTSPKHRPKPAGLGIISRDWEPRIRFAGTYDDRWLKERMPLLPDDFDDRFNQSAPQDQWLPTAAAGGQTIRVLGMTGDGLLGFTLPRGTIRVDLHYKKRSISPTMTLEGVLVDCTRRQAELTWLHSADVHGDPFQLKTLVVSTDSPDLVPRAPS